MAQNKQHYSRKLKILIFHQLRKVVSGFDMTMTMHIGKLWTIHLEKRRETGPSFIPQHEKRWTSHCCLAPEIVNPILLESKNFRPGQRGQNSPTGRIHDSITNIGYWEFFLIKVVEVYRKTFRKKLFIIFHIGLSSEQDWSWYIGMTLFQSCMNYVKSTVVFNTL